jgi:hypothetical protein
MPAPTTRPIRLGCKLRAVPSTRRERRFAPLSVIPLLQSRRPNFPRYPRKFAPPSSPFGLRRALVSLKKADHKGGYAPLGLLATRQENLAGNDARRNARARRASMYVSARTVVSRSSGPLVHLVNLVDDIGFRAIHALRDRLPYRDNVLVLRSVLKESRVYSEWIQRTIYFTVSHWLKAFKRTRRVLDLIYSDALDV